MIIRKASAADCLALCALRLAMRRERETCALQLTEKDFEEKTVRFFEENLGSDCFAAYVAEEDGRMIATGSVCYYAVPPTYRNPGGGVAYIMNMYTVPDCRKRGIAGAILHELAEDAKSRGCGSITLNASDMGRSLYLRYGFREKAGEMVFHPDTAEV